MVMSIKKHIESIVMPIFDKVLKEIPKNRMMVGRVGKSRQPFKKHCYYKPHNYRLYFDFNKESFNPETVLKQPSFPVEHKIINSTEHSYTSDHYRITVKKKQVEIINKNIRWFRIELGNVNLIKRQIKEIIKIKDDECIAQLKLFITIYGGVSKYMILNRRSEDKIKAEDVIDLLPVKQVFHNDVVKKVYNENNVEFSDPVFASNYLRNRAIEDIAPQIDDRLKSIETKLETFKYFKKENIINKINSVEDAIDNKDIIMNMSQEVKDKITKKLFKTA